MRRGRTSIPSLTWNAGLQIRDAMAEKSRNRQAHCTKSVQFQQNSASESSAAVWRCFPTPSRRISRQLGPQHTDNPEKLNQLDKRVRPKRRATPVPPPRAFEPLAEGHH